VDERNREAGELARLKTERASVAASGRQVEIEAAPIRYVAMMLEVDDRETAVPWMIALMVLCCDPLAIALTAAASAGRGEIMTSPWARPERREVRPVPIRGTNLFVDRLAIIRYLRAAHPHLSREELIDLAKTSGEFMIGALHWGPVRSL
jgi:hypothetical protein